MRALGLDPGFEFGFGLLTDDGEKPKSGFRTIPGDGEELGKALDRTSNWIIECIDAHRPDAIFIAEPFINAVSRPSNLVPLYSMMGLIELVAYRRGVDVYRVLEQEARRHFGVPTQAPRSIKQKHARSEFIKAAAIAACRQRGWPATNGHAADALIVCDYGWQLLSDQGQKSWLRTPLGSAA